MDYVYELKRKRSFLYGREILESTSYRDEPWEGGYILSPLMLKPECQISLWLDGSGGIKGPTGERLADWDRQTMEFDIILRDGRRSSKTNPYEPGGCDTISDTAALLNAAEMEVAMIHPELVRTEVRTALSA